MIPRHVEVLETKLFYGWKEVKTVSFTPYGSLTTIGDKVFGYCVSLVKLEFPDTVTTIGNAVCTHCAKLREVVLPESFTIVPDNMVQDCEQRPRVVSRDPHTFKDTTLY